MDGITWADIEDHLRCGGAPNEVVRFVKAGMDFAMLERNHENPQIRVEYGVEDLRARTWQHWMETANELL